MLDPGPADFPIMGPMGPKHTPWNSAGLLNRRFVFGVFGERRVDQQIDWVSAGAEEYLDSRSGRPNAGRAKEKAVVRGHTGGTMGRVGPSDGAPEMPHGLAVRVFSPRSLANGSLA